MTQSNKDDVKVKKNKFFCGWYGVNTKCDLFKPKDGSCLGSNYIAKILTNHLIPGPKNINPTIFFLYFQNEEINRKHGNYIIF